LATKSARDSSSRAVGAFSASCLSSLIKRNSILPESVRNETLGAGFDLSSTGEVEGDDEDDLDAIVTLDSVPANVADALIKVYVTKILPQYPFFLDEDLYAYQSLVYHGDAEEGADPGQRRAGLFDFQQRAEFVVAMMMAISTLTSKSPNYDRLVSLSKSLYRFALRQYDTLGEPCLFNLQCTMLLCQFANFCPEIAEVWTLKGMAMRMAVALGLHREPDWTVLEGFDQKQIELRRQVFWTVCQSPRPETIHSIIPGAEKKSLG
jgi:hypothetical protein